MNVFRPALFLCLIALLPSIGESKDKDAITIQWLGHAAFKLTTTKGKVILIDPFITNNPKTPAKYKNLSELGKPDVILITHAHGDHVGDGPKLAKEHNIPLYAPAGFSDTLMALEILPKALAPKFNKGGMVSPIERVNIAMTRAEHSSEFHWKDNNGKAHILNGGEPVGYIIEFENKFTVYHMGDTGLFSDMKLIAKYYRPDLVMMPIGGNFTMGPKEAAYAVTKLLKPKYVIPMHYGTFPILRGTVKEFKKLIGRTKTKVISLKPGEELKI